MAAGSTIFLTGYGTTTPPGSPANGDVHLLGTGCTGAFSGHDGELAVRIPSGWLFSPAAKLGGLYLVDSATGLPYTHTASAPVSLTTNPLTTKGDILVRTGSAVARLPVGGADGKILSVLASATEGLEWKDFPLIFTYLFNSAATTGINAETSGIIGTSTTLAGPIVPAGKTFKALACVAAIPTNTTNGTYDVDVIIRNTTDGADVVLATGAVTVSGGVEVPCDIAAFGTLASPLGTVAAGKRMKFGWRNKSTSVAAFSATQKAVAIMGIYV